MAVLRFDPPARLASQARARDRRLLGWLRDRLAARGVEAFGPQPGAAGCRLDIPAEDGLVIVRVAPGPGAAVVVTRHGEADAEYEETLAACEEALGASALEREAGA